MAQRRTHVTALSALLVAGSIGLAFAQGGGGGGGAGGGGAGGAAGAGGSTGGGGTTGSAGLNQQPNIATGNDATRGTNQTAPSMNPQTGTCSTLGSGC